MSFIVYDLSFLVLFTLLVAWFLYTRKHNLKREGLLYLYRTKVGLKVIEWTSARFGWLLGPGQYIVILSGYVLMFFMLWFLAKFSYTYLTSPFLAEQLRVPVLTPLIPYIDKLFKVDFLPPFYFIYWIIIIAIIAIPHEFAHGIYARFFKVRIRSTGFGFLGPFLAAFVEQDDKDMNRAKKRHQLAILAAGTFANVLMAVLFIFVLWAFIAMAFVPAGVYFNTYSGTILNTSAVTLAGNTSLLDMSEDLVSISSAGKKYLVEAGRLKESEDKGIEQIFVYDDAPAARAGLHGAIAEINGEKITSYEKLRKTIGMHYPGDKIEIVTISAEGRDAHEVVLDGRNGKAFLGISIIPPQASGIRGLLFDAIGKMKDPLVYYESRIGSAATFFYDLFWWIILINISVALCNMLPVGIFDGGRFFHITIWGITGSKSIADKAFKASTWIMLALIAVLMIKWAVVIF